MTDNITQRFKDEALELIEKHADALQISFAAGVSIIKIVATLGASATTVALALCWLGCLREKVLRWLTLARGWPSRLCHN